MNDVLLVSLDFPPSTLASVHRCRHLAKHLPAFGWNPVVLTANDRFQKGVMDYPLAALLPDDLEISRIAALPLHPFADLGISDISLRAFAFVRARLARLLASRRFGVVLITGCPFYHMSLAGWITRRWQVPVVLDFQDPWVSHVGAQEPRWSKAGLTHRLAVLLEPRAVRAAAFITSVSDRQNAEMAQRYPWLDARRMAGIPIGGDPEDFRRVQGAVRAPDPEHVTISYVGTVTPRALAVHDAVLRGLGRLRAEQPALAARLRLRYVGTSNQSDGTWYSIRGLAAAHQVSDLVREEPARAPFLEALRILATSDGILLIGTDEPHYTASKIYPGLMAGRPFLSVFHRLSSAQEVLATAGGGQALTFDTPASLEALVPEIAATLAGLARDPSAFGAIDPKSYEPYTAAAVSQRFAQIFDQLRAERTLRA